MAMYLSRESLCEVNAIPKSVMVKFHDKNEIESFLP